MFELGWIEGQKALQRELKPTVVFLPKGATNGR
jgi:hypothetical protein